MPTKSSRDDQQDRYYELLRLQRRVNKVLDTQVADGAAELETAQATLAREVEKLIRLDADPDIFKAIADAAWEAPNSEEFAKLAKETAAKIRLQFLTSEYGAPAAFRRTVEESEANIKAKDDRVTELRESITRLTGQLEPIRNVNQDLYGEYRITAGNRKKLEDAGFFSKMGDESLAKACEAISTYNKKNGVRRGDYFHKANCFDDMDRLEAEKEELKGLEPEVEFLKDKHYRSLAAYKEVRDLDQVLADCGADKKKAVDLNSFQEEFCARLHDEKYIACFARNTASGVGGAVILAALGASIRKKIQDNLTGYQENVREMTGHLEGPIGILAKNTAEQRPLDGIEQDIKSQALMAGYLCETAAAAFKSLTSFRPDHTEGPVSLGRDINMHMSVNGKVDPAYIHEICGMDRVLSKYFNVNARRPEPNFAEVLGNPDAVERIDRRFAKYLKDNANDEHVQDSGFSAGQFSTDSIELFLFNRYFAASASKEDVIEALEEEAKKVTEVQDEREKLGISRNGPDIQGFDNN